MVRLVLSDDREFLIPDSCLDTARKGDMIEVYDADRDAADSFRVVDMLFEVKGDKVIKVLFLGHRHSALVI